MCKQEKRRIPQFNNNQCRAKVPRLAPEVEQENWYPATYYPPSEQTSVIQVEDRGGVLEYFDRTWKLGRPPHETTDRVEKAHNGKYFVYPNLHNEEDIQVLKDF